MAFDRHSKLAGPCTVETRVAKANRTKFTKVYFTATAVDKAGNAETLKRLLPKFEIVQAMVPYNVVRLGPGRWHRASWGDLTAAEWGDSDETDVGALVWAVGAVLSGPLYLGRAHTRAGTEYVRPVVQSLALGLLLLGLADSWVDFRRRLESPPTGGSER